MFGANKYKLTPEQEEIVQGISKTMKVEKDWAVQYLFELGMMYAISYKQGDLGKALAAMDEQTKIHPSLQEFCDVIYRAHMAGQ